MTRDTVLLNKAPETRTGQARAGRGPVSLPRELVTDAARRLGWAGLIYAGAFLIAYWGWRLAETTNNANVHISPIEGALSLVAMTLGVLVFVLSRYARLDAQTVLNIGLAFAVLGSFGISVVQFWDGFAPGQRVAWAYLGIPWECVWILMVPLVAPNTPRRILFASLAEASSAPTMLLLFHATRGVPLLSPPSSFAAYFLCTTYLCAAMAYAISRIVYHYAQRLEEAHEVGSYVLLNRLGQGGMGEVWVARHRLLARPAALKLIRPELLGADQRSREMVLRRFQREATDTAALGSPHTVGIYDFGVADDGSFFYVMELLDGLSLEALVRRFGSIEPARTVYLLRQVCHSLNEAHERGLIHRDIKPANIFCCRVGSDFDFVKVLDFGLVKHAIEPEESHLTRRGSAAGTPAYMAPEMGLGKPDVDGRADIYAIGCVAYWLLTGRTVFEGESPVATILEHVQSEPVPASQRTELPIPPALDELILCCLAKDPCARPQTALELDALLAVSVLPDRWGAEDARAWWQMHHPARGSTPLGAEDETRLRA